MVKEDRRKGESKITDARRSKSAEQEGESMVTSGAQVLE